MSVGLARGHRGSPAAALRVHQLHCTPVLFSGLATLVLNKAEIKIIDKYYQNIIQNLQRLHQKTPRSIVFFLAGSLSGEAILHMRQLSIFSMICQLPSDPLHHHAHYVLSMLPPSSLSRFHQMRTYACSIACPNQLTLLEHPVSKERFKRLVKVKVTEYWQHILAEECSSPDMTLLVHFDPRSINATNDRLCLRAPDPAIHPSDNTHSNTLTFSGSGLAAANQDLYLDHAHDIVPAHPVEVQPRVLRYDKPPILRVSQLTSGVIGRDVGWWGGGCCCCLWFWWCRW